MNFNYLNKLVNESKLGKSKIAEVANISRTTLDNALNGADIKISTIESLASVLGVNVGCFFDCESKYTNAIANGQRSIAAINSDVNLGSENNLLQERIKHLEELLAEKERMIRLYEKMMDGKI